MSEYTTGDLDLKLKIHSEKNVTIDFVVNEATTIWRDVRKRKLRFGDEQATKAVMAEMQRKHPEFCKSYPIVNRYICEMQEYDAKAFRRWLMGIKSRPWKTEAEYLDAQAEYVVTLFRVKKPRSNATQISNLRTNIRALLQKEHDTFKRYAEEFNREVTAEEETFKDRNKNELKEFMNLAKDTMHLAGTIRVESDVTPYSLDVPTVDELVANIKSTPLDTCADDLLL